MTQHNKKTRETQLSRRLRRAINQEAHEGDREQGAKERLAPKIVPREEIGGGQGGDQRQHRGKQRLARGEEQGVAEIGALPERGKAAEVEPPFGQETDAEDFGQRVEEEEGQK